MKCLVLSRRPEPFQLSHQFIYSVYKPLDLWFLDLCLDLLLSIRSPSLLHMF